MMMQGQQPAPAPDLSALLAGLTDEEKQKVMRLAMENQDDSMMQSRLMEIMAMSPEDRSVAIADLSEAYEPMRDDIRGELAQNYDLLTAQSPQGQVAGNNQFSVYVGANPLEHLASGINKYQAGKGIRENREELEGLNKRQAGASADMMNAQMRALEAKATADALRGETPEQKRRREEQERMKQIYGNPYGSASI